MTTTDIAQRRQKFVDDLVTAVRECGKQQTDAKDTAAEVARYALLRVQLARSEAKLKATAADRNGSKDEASSASKTAGGYFSIRSMLGLEVMSGWSFLTLVLVSLVVHAHRNEYFHLLDYTMESLVQRCILSGEDMIVEMARAPVNCEMCRDIREMPTEHNMTRELFLERYAYTARPVLIKNVVKDWKALNNFSLEFFKNLYDSKPESFKTQDDAGQFFAYKTEFTSLKEALHMSQERQMKDWYFGWSNADEDIGHQLREYYDRPEFLPEDAESSRIDWMFMGISAKGAQLHIDYVNRPSWQAQIKGRKIWEVVPSPECMSVCHSFNVTVHPGDIINIDTNRWYHATYVHPGDFSVTIGSEYD